MDDKPQHEQLVKARVVQNNCPDCLRDVAQESCGEYPLEGEVVLIPLRWLTRVCSHGRSGLTFEAITDAAETVLESRREKNDEIELEPFDTRMDATKNIGFPIREHGPYGSHPMHDDFDDESDPDGSGIY